MPKYRESQHSVRTDESKIKAAWWKEAKDKQHDHLVPLVKRLAEEQQERDRANRIYFSMYAGAEYTSLDGAGYAKRSMRSGLLSLNLTQILVSTAASKIAKNKPRILCMTEGGDWSQQARGKRMTKAINGTFQELGLYEKMQQTFVDAGVFDFSSVQLYRDGDKVAAERVLGHEQRVDMLEARYGLPRQRHKHRQVAREVLIEKYGAEMGSAVARKLKETKRAESYEKEAARYLSDMVDVWESIHLPSGPDADDGRHVICVENATLHCEEWTRARFPYVDLRWEIMPLGFYGMSVAAQIAGIQYAVNKRLRDIEEHMDLSTGYVAIEAGSSIDKADFTNEIWRLIEFANTPPQYIAPPVIPPAKLQHLQFLLEQAYERTGISAMSAHSEKPAGLNSGKALREYNDIESERFQMNAQRYENAFVDAAEIVTDFYEEIYGDDKGLRVRAYSSKLLESIEWKKARMDREDYTVRTVPTSFLPSTPAAKYAQIQEMLQAGFLTREDAMMLLDYPDLERVSSMVNAPRLYVDMLIEHMLDPDDPKYRPPEPFDKHQLALRCCTDAYNDARLRGAPEENLELLRRYIKSTERLIKQKQPPAPAAAPGAVPPPMPQTGAPPPMPMAPPVMQ